MSCQIENHKKICGRLYNSVPCCDDALENYFPLSFPGAQSEVCIVEVFELAKTAAENKLIRFRSKGTCMYPCLMPGETLHVEPKTAEQIKINDIAVFRRSDYLYAHRTIDKGKYGDASYILTRPDRSENGNDGPSFDSDIIGVVASVERKGNGAHSLEKKDITSTKGKFLKLYNKWHLFKKVALAKIIIPILYIQQIRIYKKIAAFLFLALRKKIDLSLRSPLNFKITSRFYQDISREDLKSLVSEAKEGVPIGWSIVASMDSIPSGTVSFVHKPQGCLFSGWWISGLNVRIRYRGMGIEEHLFRETEAVLKELKVKELFVSFYKEKRLRRMVFKNLGFKEVSVYNDKFYNAEKNMTEIPVVMLRQII